MSVQRHGCSLLDAYRRTAGSIPRSRTTEIVDIRRNNDGPWLAKPLIIPRPRGQLGRHLRAQWLYCRDARDEPDSDLWGQKLVLIESRLVAVMRSADKAPRSKRQRQLRTTGTHCGPRRLAQVEKGKLPIRQAGTYRVGLRQRLARHGPDRALRPVPRGTCWAAMPSQQPQSGPRRP